MIHLNNIVKQYGSKILFEDATAVIGHRSRIALIGPNGAGKSTLIKMILGQESPDSGVVSRAKNLAIGHLAQEVPRFTDRTVLEEVMRLDGRRESLLSLKNDFEIQFSKNEATEADLERYGRILEELEHLDEYRLESRAQEILSGVGFSTESFHKPLSVFSGGWLMRVALARVLLQEPDLLLLDEPTNHLDLESLLWLEDFLMEYKGALLLVSHDSAFLNRMVNEVLEIDGHRLWIYKGNLDSYAAQKQERLEILRAQYQGQQAKIADIESFVARFGAKATKARQAQSRLKQLEKMDLIELPDEQQRVRFRFPPAPHSGKEVVTLKQVSLHYGEKRIFEGLDTIIQKGKRIAIVGVNGAGKTTLLRLLAGHLEATSGLIKYGHMVQVGYYAQMQAESLDLKKTVLQELEASSPETDLPRIRAIAGAFLFSGDAVDKKCSVLSGGEKARIALAKLLLTPSNFLLLDEPTNHLDVESRGVLLDALLDYEGTLCIISHDRDFIGPLADTILEIIPSNDVRKGSQILALTETYDDYVQRKLKETALNRKLSKEAAAIKPKEAKDFSVENPVRGSSISNNQRKSWERERDRLEADIVILEKRQQEIHVALADDSTYAQKELSLKLVQEQHEIELKLGTKLSRWEELESLLSS